MKHVCCQAVRSGELAAFAKRKGKVWYVAVINGTDKPKEFTLKPVFLKGKYKATVITDGEDGFMLKEEKIKGNAIKKFVIPATGGMVIQFTRA